ncbi:unnamed protein product [Durusdinium trenchii]|uniref:Glyoxylate reductase n=2 Tax=Durusdinium trenchii TaxID=1381693 RepID=A0ABP0QER6_9DINO
MDAELEPLVHGVRMENLDPGPSRAKSFGRGALILVSLSLFIALGAWIDQSHGVPTEQIEHAESDNDQIKGNSPYQLKYVIGQSHRPAPLGTCIATLMRRPTCRRPMVLFMMALLLVLTCVCCCEVYSCCACCGGHRRKSAIPEEEQLRSGKEELEELLKKKSINFVADQWSDAAPKAEIEEKIQRSWDVSYIAENFELIEEVVRIMKEYPGLKLHVKGCTTSKMAEKDLYIVRSAFGKDFSEDFPWAVMDLEMAYAQGRVLSLKRILGDLGISHKRIRTSYELTKERKIVLELEVQEV